MKSPQALFWMVVLLAVLAAGLLMALSQLSVRWGEPSIRESGKPTPAAETATVNGTKAKTETKTETKTKSPDRGLHLRQPTLGDPDAPVLIVEFAEFYCPYCAKFLWETFPKIEEEYIATGLVRYEFRNLVVHGDAALLAAVAGECAHDQGRFWPYLDRLFAAVFPERNFYRHEELGVEDLTRIAEEIGLNRGEFAHCLEGYAAHREGCHEELLRCTRGSGDRTECQRQFVRCMNENPMYREIVEDRDNLDYWIAHLPPEEQGQAERLGTPAFFINGRLLFGARPYSLFRQRIEEELARLREEG
jgi:protein-disulfide isomerase